YNKQIEIAHNDINNKYQALLLQVNMLTVVRDGHKKSTNQLNSNTLQKEMIDNEIYQLSNGYTEQNYNQFIQMKKQKVNDMKSLLTFGCEVIVKHNDVIPERNFVVNNIERRVGYDLNGNGYIGGEGKLERRTHIDFNRDIYHGYTGYPY
ncbi:unnamed protein product, partial [Adineta steineri]